MREFEIHNILFGGEFGQVNLEMDGSQGIERGHWRQRPPFNACFAAAGNWQCLRSKYNRPDYYFYDSNGFFAKPVLTMDDCYLTPGRRGSGFANIPSGNCDLVWSFLSSQKVQEWTIQDLAKTIIDSTWRITGSKGISYGVGRAITVEGNTGSIFLRGDSELAGTEHELVYSTAGLGIGTSELPFVVSGSTADMPSGGIGKIYTNRAKMSLMDFEGVCGIVEVNGCVGPSHSTGEMAAGGGGLYVIYFGNGLLSGLESWGLMWGSSIGIVQNTNRTLGSVGGAATLGTCVVMR